MADHKQGLWADVDFTPEEARSLLHQIDSLTTTDPVGSAERRERWARIEAARERLATPVRPVSP